MPASCSARTIALNSVHLLRRRCPPSEYSLWGAKKPIEL